MTKTKIKLKGINKMRNENTVLNVNGKMVLNSNNIDKY